MISIGAFAGWVASLIGIPLAWMVGPFVCVGAATLAFDLPQVPPPFRAVGQVIVGGAIGLYLSPLAVKRIAESIVEITAAATAITVAGCIIGILQARLTRTDLATAIYSAVPGGPVDMAVMAAQQGGDPVRTAISQITRIAMVVLLFPPLITLSSAVIVVPESTMGGWADSAILLAVGLACGLGGRLIGLINPFFLGPLIVVGALSAAGAGLSSHHAGVIPMAQVLLGVSLGGLFQRSVFRKAGSFVVSTLVTTSLLLGISAVVAEILSLTTGIDLPTMFLANAPGAVTEMVLTAKVLQLDVPMVASFQIVRILVGVLLVGALLRLARRIF